MSYSLAKRLGPNKYQSEIEDLKKQVSQLSETCDIKTKEIEELQIKTSNNEKIICEQQLKNEELVSEITLLRSEKKEIAECLSKKDCSYKTVLSSNQQLQEKVDKLSYDIGTLKDIITQRDKDYCDLEIAMKTLSEKYSQQMVLNNELENNNSMATTELKYTKNLLEATQKELAEIKAKIIP